MDLKYGEIMLIVAAVVAFLIVWQYRKDKDSNVYNLVQIIGVITGVALIAVCACGYFSGLKFDLALIIIAAFALIIRPFRQSYIALLAAIVLMIAVYVYLGSLTAGVNDPDFIKDLIKTLSTNTIVKIVIAVIIGGFFYMILNFVEKIAHLIGKFLNLWPVLAVLGAICLVEAVLLIFADTSIFNYIQDYRNGAKIIAALIY